MFDGQGVEYQEFTVCAWVKVKNVSDVGTGYSVRYMVYGMNNSMRLIANRNSG